MSDETEMKAPTLVTTMCVRATPQDAVPASMHRTGAIGRFWHHRTSAMQDLAIELRRIPQPVEKVDVGPVGGPKELQNKAKTLRIHRFQPLVQRLK